MVVLGHGQCIFFLSSSTTVSPDVFRKVEGIRLGIGSIGTYQKCPSSFAFLASTRAVLYKGESEHAL